MARRRHLPGHLGRRAPRHARHPRPHRGPGLPAALNEIVDRLRRAGCIAAEEEAAEILAVAAAPEAVDAMVARREDGEPLAWITGRVRFCDRWWRVDPGVYVPRPQSEELARRAAAALPPGGTALDLCCGAGVIAGHLAASGAVVVGIDVDPRAAACARANGVAVVLGDLAAPLRADAGLDVVTAVAPYVPHDHLDLLPSDVRRFEPQRALDGGDGGVELVLGVVAAAAELLRPGGWLFTEVGGDQDTVVGPALAARGFDTVLTWADADGDLRGVAAHRSI